ncbi:MAG TPA: hypothetical protein VD931_12470 [Baekduia sp.]|nr:hypothetical protein [Baekduia sp.]
MTQPALPGLSAPLARREAGSTRDPLDRYYTPVPCTTACLRAIDEFLGELGIDAPARWLEPSVGAGGWLPASRLVWPWADVDRVDIDPAALGLSADLRPTEAAYACDFTLGDIGPAGDEDWYDAVGGNPPYNDTDAESARDRRERARWLCEWVDRSLSFAPIVWNLLRGTALGSIERAPWWRGAGAPACVWTLAPRVPWEGPGAHESGDSVDQHLVLWVRGETDTRHRWLAWR